MTFEGHPHNDALSVLLKQTVQALAQGGPELAEPAQYLDELVSRPPHVAVVGRLKSGKSTLVNALTEYRIAATESLECTMAVSLYSDGAPARAEIHGIDGTTHTIALGAEPLTDLNRPVNEVDHVRQFLPNARLRQFTLIDTPGTATLTVENEARTRRVLIEGRKDTKRASSWADCVVFLSDSAPRDDERTFLTELGMTPLTIVGILSRADSFGAGAFGNRDPLEHAHSHAHIIADQLSHAVCTVLPLAGLLAESALTGRVSTETARQLALLAGLDRDNLLEALEIDDPTTIVAGLSATMRDELLDTVGEYGIVVGRDIAKTVGAVGLLRWLKDVSGIDTLTSLITGELMHYALLQRAVQVLEQLENLANQSQQRAHVRQVQSILLAQPIMQSVLLYRSFKNIIANTPDSRFILPLRQSITATCPAEIIGLPAQTPIPMVRSALENALGEFRELAMSPLSAAEDDARERLIITYQAALRELVNSY